ncbi:dynein intermediate chain 2, ciliary [Trichonephila clavata]|uniref:Dynein intermediate chain 2, ciliary n=1 Tax=Trichonephila clavata TaxID=2740835 RepID=A0A8X6L1A3_TRICU|nr:dynein intermediate chain 2, ciliary [Trichonephila clavata]
MANCNGREALRMYRQKYPSRKMPSRSFFATIYRRLCETGSLDVHKPDSGRQRISRTVDAEERVVHAHQRNPSTSLRVVSRETHIPQTIVWRIVHDEGHYSYHLQCVQALQPGDYSSPCASTLSVNPHDLELFLVGTEMGLIHRGSLNDKRCDATYSEHKSQVYRVQWNYLHPRVFLSCAEDYTIQIWDHTERHSMFEFFFEHEVNDVAWAPFSSTLFAAISGNAIVSVFDLAIDKIEAIGMFTCYTAKQNVKLTKLAFHPVKPVLIVGDDR